MRIARGLSFSWKSALGIDVFKRRIARATGIPLTRQGRQPQAQAPQLLLPRLQGLQSRKAGGERRSGREQPRRAEPPAAVRQRLPAALG